MSTKELQTENQNVKKINIKIEGKEWEEAIEKAYQT